MFEIMRRQPSSGLRELMNWISSDPFFQASSMLMEEEGNLAVDVSEGEGEIIVRANMPGFKKDEIEAQIHNGVLCIKAEHDEEQETKNERFYRKERRHGAVTRRIALPGIIDESKVQAELKDGVLTLHVPQPEATKPKKLQIK